MPTAKKSAKKPAPRVKKATMAIPAPKAAVRAYDSPSKLTWALAVTFFVLSIVFVSQAYYYCYM